MERADHIAANNWVRKQSGQREPLSHNLRPAPSDSSPGKFRELLCVLRRGEKNLVNGVL